MNRHPLTAGPAAALAAFAALAFAAPSAHADADPALGYIYGSYAIPYHLSTGVSKSGFLDGSEWSTKSPTFGKRTLPPNYSAFGLDAVGFGAGIGYDGWNVQLDILHASSISAGALTLGYRLNLQFGNFEAWGRLAAGPQMTVSYSSPTSSSRSGGILTVAECGFDYFIMKEFLALGIKGSAAPAYSWKLDFSADFDVKFGIRLII